MGQFDQTIDPDQGLSLAPAAGLDPLSPEALGVPAALLGSAVPPAAPMRPPVPMPTPPEAPAAPGNLQRILSMAMLGLAAGLGPRHGGGGVAQGLMAGQEANDQDRKIQFQQQQQQYALQQQEALRQQVAQAAQQRAEAVQQDQRQKALQGALTTIRTEVKTIPDKATYDTRIDGYANLLKASGYRLDANWLRSAIPYVAPSAKGIAQEAVTSLFKNPLLQDQIKNNPQSLQTGSIMIDLNGDGIKEKRTIQEVMDAAGMATITDDTGKPIALSPSSTGDAMQIALRSKLDLFRAENRRDPTPKERDDLVTAARTPPKDPDVAEQNKRLKDLQIQGADLSNQLKVSQAGQQPTSDQIAMYGKMLVDHKMSPSQVQIMGGGMGQQGRNFLRQVQAEALKQDPNFNFEEAESEYQLVKSPSFQNTVRYMDSVTESMPRLQQTANTLANGRVRGINALINAGKNQFNNVDLKKFHTDVLFVSDEIAKILQGGGTGSGTSDAKLRQAGDILSTSDSPAAISGALQEASFMMQNRRRSLTRGTYLDKPVADPAASAREKLMNR